METDYESEASPEQLMMESRITGWLRFALLLVGVAALTCGSASADSAPPVWGSTVDTSQATVSPFVSGLEHPWSIAWLPSGDALITERPGRLRVLARGTTTLSPPLDGVPAVVASGQGGLFDVAVDPQFETTRYIYLSLASGTPSENRTQVVRAKLTPGALTEPRVIFSVNKSKAGTQHFGGRLAFLRDGTLLLSVGDGGNAPAMLEGDLIRNQSQALTSHLGKIIRINTDGSTPADNPLRRNPAALPEIFSIGHRNIQGLSVDSATGEIFSTEHGPRGGDELNRIVPGANYGWPLVTFGVEYSGKPITTERSRPGLRDPLGVWVPSIAPSGLVRYRGKRFPEWQGYIFAGGLVSTDLRMITLAGGSAAREQYSIPIGARVRDVREGPDGFLYVLTDERDGKLLRVQPAAPNGTGR